MKFKKLFQTTIEAQDSLLSWVALAASICMQCTNIGFLWSFSILYSSLLEEFNASREKTAWIGAIPYGIQYFFCPFVSWLTRGFSIRICLIVAAVTTGSSLLLTSVAESLDVMFFTFSVLFGIGSCIAYFTITRAINSYFNRRLSIANGFLTGGIALLQIALTQLIIALLENYGLKKTFRIYGVAATILCLICSLAFHPTSYETKSKTDDNSSAKGINDYIVLMKNKVLILWIVAQMILCLEYSVSVVHQVQFAIESGISVQTARQFPFYSAIAASIGRISSGFFFNIQSLDKVYAFQGFLIATALTSFIGSFSTNQYHFISFIWIFAALEGGVQASFVPTLRFLVGLKDLSEATSIVVMFASISIMGGSPFLGFIVDKTGSYKAYFYVAGAPLLTASLVLVILRCFKDFKPHTIDDELNKQLEPINKADPEIMLEKTDHEFESAEDDGNVLLQMETGI